MTEASPGVRCGRTPTVHPPGGPRRGWRRDRARPAPRRRRPAGAAASRRRRRRAAQAARNASAPMRSTTNFMRPLAGSSKSPWSTNTSMSASTAASASRAGDEAGEQHGERRAPCRGCRRPRARSRGSPSTTTETKPGVVHQGVVAAAGRAAEGDVDPAGQRDVQLGRPGDDGVGDQPGVGQAVERLVEADAGVLGAHDVAQRVAARRAGGEAGPVDGGEHAGDPAVVHPVQLDVLAGGEVQPVLGRGGRRGGPGPAPGRWAARRRGSAPAP